MKRTHLYRLVTLVLAIVAAGSGAQVPQNPALSPEGGEIYRVRFDFK